MTIDIQYFKVREKLENYLKKEVKQKNKVDGRNKRGKVKGKGKK